MSKRKTEEECFSNFITQMKNAGVKDKTIELVLADIEEYQQQQCEAAIKGMFERFKKVVLERIDKEDESI